MDRTTSENTQQHTETVVLRERWYMQMKRDHTIILSAVMLLLLVLSTLARFIDYIFDFLDGDHISYSSYYSTSSNTLLYVALYIFFLSLFFTLLLPTLSCAFYPRNYELTMDDTVLIVKLNDKVKMKALKENISLIEIGLDNAPFSNNHLRVLRINYSDFNNQNIKYVIHIHFIPMSEIEELTSLFVGFPAQTLNIREMGLIAWG